MRHPFDVIKSEYETCLAGMKISADRIHEVDALASKLLRLERSNIYAPVSGATGIPQSWIAASFEREASSDFRRSPAQGDFWDRVSTHVPKGRGPYASWAAAAEDSYRREGLAAIGRDGWTWARGCYEGEAFNGFGYRDYHHMRTPYLWGATNMQEAGKYTADGHFDSSAWDHQIGMVPVMMRMAEIDPGPNALAGEWPFPERQSAGAVPAMAPQPTGMWDCIEVQHALNVLGYGPLLEDGSYGKITRSAVLAFQRGHPPLDVDGIAGPQTVSAMHTAIAAMG